jgi:CIC family chloride channel protein
MGLAMLVGIVAGLGAIGFFLATQAAATFMMEGVVGYHPLPHPEGEVELTALGKFDTQFSPLKLLIVITVGGLLSGLLVYSIAPEAEGHGTDSVISAYHNRQGEIRLRVPIVKIIASALTLGSGGSGGREGPIAQIGAGFASLLSRLLNLRPMERRVLVAAGMGAGIAAIFRAPLAGALFAAEVLYWSPEFEPEVIIPAGLASVISYCVYGLAFGWEPLLAVPTMSFTNPWQLFPYLLLSLAMVLLAAIFTRTFYGITYLFEKLPVLKIYRPAIGAFLTGLLGIALFYAFGKETLLLAVFSFGYNALQYTLNEPTLHDPGALGAGVLLTIALGKIVTTSLTIGSGGSGGVFGPSMVIGGCGGGALGVLLHSWWPELVPHPASFAIVGMAGFFSAAAKTPFSTLIIVSEMTNGYHLLLPALFVCVVSFVLSDEQSLYRSQVESRSRSPAHRGAFVRELLGQLRVSQFLSTISSDAVMLHPNDTVATIVHLLEETHYPVLPVVDDDGKLQGVVNLEDAHVASLAPHMQPFVLAADVMRTDVTPLSPDDSLEEAMQTFVELDLLALPVVNNLKDRTVIGLVRRSALATTYVRKLHGDRNTPQPLS